MKKFVRRIDMTPNGGMSVRTDFILEGEGLNALSARLRVPACMLMRANGLYSPAWLLPGREIVVPEGRCTGPIPCPRAMFMRRIGEHEAMKPVHAARRRIYFCGIEDTAAGIAARFGLSEEKLRADNALSGAVYPGMALLIDPQRR